MAIIEAEPYAVGNNDYCGSLVNSRLFDFRTVDPVRRQLAQQCETFPTLFGTIPTGSW